MFTSHRESNFKEIQKLNKELPVCRVNMKFRIEREKFYPIPGLEPEPVALRANTTELSRKSTFQQ